MIGEAEFMILDDTTLLAMGRWRVRAAGSRLVLVTMVCGMVGVRGRFTALAGRVDMAAEPRIAVDVATVSLTTGNARRDALLHAAGLIDPAAGPLIHYRSCGVTGRRVDGVISTARSARPLALEIVELVPVADGVRLHGRGSITRDDVDDLLARPGAARLLGASADLDLTVELAPA